MPAERAAARGRPWPVATVVTQMVVDPNDPAFSNPTKPVGPFYSAEKAEQLRAEGFHGHRG